MNKDPNTQPKREAEVKHQQQFIWQILIPLLAALFIALGIAVLDIIAAGSESTVHSQWAMIATILLVLVWLILGLIPLALVILSIWLLRNSHKSISPYLAATSVIMERVKTRAQGITNAMTSPAIKVRSADAGLKHLLRIVFHQKSSSKE